MSLEDKVAGEKIRSADINAIIAALGAVTSVSGVTESYIIYYDSDAALYVALNGTTGTTSTNATLSTLVTSTLTAMSEGLIVIKDLDIPSVTEKDGVIIISYNDGIYTIHMTNPTSETATQTNTQNCVSYNILMQPTNDPPTLDAWNAFTSEIIGLSGLSCYLVAGYFGAQLPSGDASNIWALNPVITLDSGSTGSGISIEVDINNDQGDDVGEAITVAGAGNFNPYAALHITHQNAKRFNRGIFIEDVDDYGIIVDIDQASTVGQAFTVANGISPSYVFGVYYNSNIAWQIAVASGLPTLYIRDRSGGGGDILNIYDGADANPKVKLTHNALYMGAGGGTAVDCILTRATADIFRTNDALSFLRTNATDASVTTEVSGDTEWRFYIRCDGELAWGPGNAAQDVTLYRAGANVLQTPDTFKAANIQPVTNYLAVDGTGGTTQAVVTADDGTLNFKNGLFVGVT